MKRYPLFWLERTPEGRWRPSDGREFLGPDDAGIGALWSAEVRWVAHRRAQGLTKRYPDGLYVCVMLPGGQWEIDGPAHDARGFRMCPWTRTGDPRRPAAFSVHPSINMEPTYHGWVRNGFVEPA